MGIIIITIHIFWAFIGMMVAIGTIATIDCQSKFYWRHMSKNRKTQPRVVMRGMANEISLKDGIITIK